MVSGDFQHMCFINMLFCGAERGIALEQVKPEFLGDTNETFSVSPLSHQKSGYYSCLSWYRAGGCLGNNRSLLAAF